MEDENKNKYNIKQIIALIIIGICAIIAMLFSNNEDISNNVFNDTEKDIISYSLDDIPEYEGEPYIYLNNNIPDFDEEDLTYECFEQYSDLDEHGRCGVAFANLGKDTMPKDDEKRTNITDIYPTGWQEDEYAIVSGKKIFK